MDYQPSTVKKEKQVLQRELEEAPHNKASRIQAKDASLLRGRDSDSPLTTCLCR